jgi:hypothetical protein
MKHLLIILSVSISITSFAQKKTTSNYISIELDPAPFILEGYSLSIKYSPKKTPKIAFMGSVYSSRFPNSMMSQQNKDNGWRNLKLETSYAIFAEFYLKSARQGFYLGPSLFVYNKSVELSSVNERIQFNSVYPNIRFGYVWHPFKTVDLYINPWLNIGSEFSFDNKNNINGIEFELSKFYYILALHLGYKFSW